MGILQGLFSVLVSGFQAFSSRKLSATFTLVIGLTLLCLLLLHLWRRHRERRLRLEDGDAPLVASHTEESQALAAHATLTGQEHRVCSNVIPRHPTLDTAELTAVPLIAAAAVASTHTREQSGARLGRSVTVTSLPNPYEHIDVAVPVTSRSLRDRDLPPTPWELQAVYPSALSHTNPTSSTNPFSSRPPSSFADPAGALERGTTTRTTTSTTSTLHSEMAAYQKRLEAQQEEELQTARDDIPTSAAVLEPPPEYREQLSTGSSTSLIGNGHGLETTTGH